MLFAPSGPCCAIHRVDKSYSCLEGIPGVEYYGSRILCLTDPGDTICLHPDLEGLYPQVTGHYDRVGLDVTRIACFDTSRDSAINHDGPISWFMFGPAEHRIRPDHPRLRATTAANNKNVFIRECRRSGLQVPVPPTHLYSAGQAPTSPRLGNFAKGPWYVKAAVAASGQNLAKCDTWAGVIAASTQIGSHGDYQVQKAVANAAAFLNVQYYVNEYTGSIRHIATTEQILDGNVHDGNRYPTRYDPRNITDKLAAYWAKQGVRGVIAFDVIAIGKPHHATYLALECNPRFNGSTAPTGAALRLGIAQWSSRSIPIGCDPETALKRIQTENLEYGRTQEGLVIINWGALLVGKLNVLVAGDPGKQDALLAAAHEALAG